MQALDVKDVFPFILADPIGKTITKITDGKIELYSDKSPNKSLTEANISSGNYPFLKKLSNFF